MFITAAMFRIAPGGRRLTITSAGHNPVMIYRAESRSVDTVEAFGPPLGLFPGAEYGHVELELREGDVVLLYTDGVTEAMAAGGDEMFSEERLERLLIDVAGESAAGDRQDHPGLARGVHRLGPVRGRRLDPRIEGDAGRGIARTLAGSGSGQK